MVTPPIFSQMQLISLQKWFTLPPNTTHLMQPLDNGVFGLFKQHWWHVCQDYQVSHPGQVISCYNFCQLFSKAWIESMTASNTITGFETTGIYPVDREAIKLPGESVLSQRSIIAPHTPFHHSSGSLKMRCFHLRQHLLLIGP